MSCEEDFSQIAAATAALQSSIDWLVPAYGDRVRLAHAAAVPFLKLWGLAAGGWQMGRAALVATEHLARNDGDADFMRAKIATARFYAECLLPQTEALAQAITEGSESVLALPAEQF